MKREAKYLTFDEIDDIFQYVYGTGWPGPKVSTEDETFALLIQQASMRKNGITIPQPAVENNIL